MVHHLMVLHLMVRDVMVHHMTVRPFIKRPDTLPVAVPVAGGQVPPALRRPRGARAGPRAAPHGAGPSGAGARGASARGHADEVVGFVNPPLPCER